MKNISISRNLVLGLLLMFFTSGTFGQWNEWSTYGFGNGGYMAELNGSVYLANRVNNVQRTSDNAQTWDSVGPWTIGVRSLHILNNSIFVGTVDGLFRSDDEGVTWTNVTGIIATSMTGSIYVHRIREIGGNLYVILGIGGGDGMYRSTNNGNSWEDIHYSNWRVVDVIEHNGALYTIDISQRFQKSIDDGASWINMPAITGSVLAMESIDDKIILIGGDGVIYSPDDATSWYGSAYPYTTDIEEAHCNIVELDGYYYCNAGYEVARSIDGVTWEAYNGGVNPNDLVYGLYRAGNADFALQSNAYSIASTIGLEELVIPQLGVAPNPSNGAMHITLPDTWKSPAGYELFNCLGSLVASGPVPNSTFMIEHPGASGTYVLIITNGEAPIRTRVVFE